MFSLQKFFYSKLNNKMKYSLFLLKKKKKKKKKKDYLYLILLHI